MSSRGRARAALATFLATSLARSTAPSMAASLALLASVALVACREPVSAGGGAGSPSRPSPSAVAQGGAPARPHPAMPADAAQAAQAAEAAPIEGGFRELDVPGFRPAYVFVPPGLPSERRPLAVVAHGAGGNAEPHCEHWRRLLSERAFLVCPRGTPLGAVPEGQSPTGYFYRDHRALGREVMAARAAAIEAFGARLDVDGALYAGFSQGATMGALFLHELADTPDRGAFARLVLVDGGWVEWTRGLAEKERASGLARVVLVCGQTRCAREGKKRVQWMEQAALPIRFEYAQGAGHTWGGAVAEKVEGALGWLFEGDARFLAPE